MRLYVVRHGQTAWNVEGRAQGHTEIDLDATGRRQALQLGARLAGEPIDRILSSDLERCLQTAQPAAIALGLTIEPRPELRERSFGDWEGSLFRDFRHRIVGDPLRFRPPNGESFHDVWDRLADVVEELRSADESTAIFTHGASGSLLLARLMGGTVLTSRALRLDNTSVTVLKRRPDDHSFVLERYNDASHVEDDRVAEVNVR